MSLWRQPGNPQKPPFREDALITAAQRGDRAAFDALVHAYHTALCGFVARRAGADSVEDVSQEIWLACWAGLEKFDRRSRFQAWLYGIAVHKCADYHRTRRHLRYELSYEEAVDVLPCGTEPMAAVEVQETIKALLARLPPVQREVIELYYFAELTLPEIAAILARNLNTVKWQFYRAHAQLAESGLA